MPPRKDRIAIVLDTNVLIANYLSFNPSSASSTVIRLWRNERRLQLIVSEEIVQEYLEIMQRLGIEEHRLLKFRQRLEQRSTVTWVKPARSYNLSRDPDDNLFLDVARSGKVEFLVTLDHDLIDLPEVVKRRFRFAIVTPGELLSLLGD